MPAPVVTTRKPINMANASTLVALAVLVGTEFIGASWAAGWALSGFYGFPPLLGHITEGAFALIGVMLLVYFMRVALRAEPLRG